MKHTNWIKRLGAIALSLTLLLSLSAITAAADESDVTVKVTIADANGTLALALADVTVTDIDGDNALTVNDALYCAHEAYYEGGAAAGYAAAQSDYGLSLAKLWGAENGGSYGYYVNDVASMSLSDPIADGDEVNAFVYTDLTAWSDTYCYFDIKEAKCMGVPKEKAELTLILSAAGYDADWNPVTLPVTGATITINGEKTAFVTDENGQVTVHVPALESGTYVISAVSDTQTLVPPVCMFSVELDEVSEIVPEEPQETVVTDPEPAIAPAVAAIAPVVAATAPATGDAGSTVAGIALLGALCAAGLTLSLKRRDK